MVSRRWREIAGTASKFARARDEGGHGRRLLTGRIRYEAKQAWKSRREETRIKPRDGRIVTMAAQGKFKLRVPSLTGLEKWDMYEPYGTRLIEFKNASLSRSYKTTEPILRPVRVSVVLAMLGCVLSGAGFYH